MEPEEYYCPVCGRGPLPALSAAQACATEDDADDRQERRRAR